MGSDFQREFQAAVEAVAQAAKLCRAVQSQITPDVLQKKDRSPVTVADFGSQALVCRHLAEAFPNDPMIAEEDSAELHKPDNAELLSKVVAHVGADVPGAKANEICRWIDHGNAKQYSDRFWTLDPIDGTKGFLRKEQYAVALALIVKGRITVAALACPNLPASTSGGGGGGAVFTAVRGHGAYMRGLSPFSAASQKKGTDPFSSDAQPIHVTPTADTAEARFCESVESGHSSHDDSHKIAELLKITKQPARMDSQAKYASVARGEADIYMRLPTRKDYVERIWDHAAGALVVAEAGGKVTDIHGKPLDFTHGAGLERNRGVIVTNGKLHDKVLAAIKAVGIQ